ncbi:tol-pal system-associated acyl-CoA thioesterase [Alcaligenaceae bacterium CGII-47]|nr:tol-pal system-associated acyl-CoA thioesterase [Alcaligenaceae bacterium CGII-47]
MSHDLTKKVAPSAATLGTDLCIRVYYEDTDAGGVVYYANYLKFFERGRTEWLRSLGIDQRELAAQEAIMFVVTQANIEYQRPAHLDDQIDITTHITELGAASISFEQSAQCDGMQRARGRFKVCVVHAQTFKPTRLPLSLRTLLEQARN